MTGVEERMWEDYGSVTLVGANRDTVELSGRLPRYFEAPATESLTYNRKYTLTDDALDVEVTLTNLALAPVTFTSLWENLPFPVCDTECAKHLKGRKIGFADANGAPLASGDYPLGAVHVVDEAKHGLAIELASPQTVRIRPVGLRQVRYDESVQIGRVEVPFPKSALAPGESMSLSYKIRTLDPVASVPPIVAINDAPQIVCGPAVNGNGGEGGAGGNGVGGAGASGGSGGSGGGPSDDGACGCRTVGSSPSTGWAGLTLLALAGALRGRRKRVRVDQ